MVRVVGMVRMAASAKVVMLATVLQWVVSMVGAQSGTWQVLQKNAGVSSMHSAVTRFNTVIFLDRTNTGPSQIKLPNGRCRNQTAERVSKIDCYAHSVMFNPANGAVRPLFVFTDTWCSSGQFMGNGAMVQTGGDFEGNKVIRTLSPCAAGGNCDWVETTQSLAKGRWYSTNHILPGGTRQIVVGGRNEPTYEFVPPRKAGEGAFALSVLQGCCDNLYPFVNLLPNGDLFVFTNRDSVVLNYGTGKVVKNLPTIPGNPRNYPSGGSAALLPIKAPYTAVEILVCGGAATGASKAGNRGAAASASCGRISPTAATPTWTMENMPINRVMGDMVILPTGEVLIINGAQVGYQGWGTAGSPALTPVKYNADARAGTRFTKWAPTTIPRMYHSTANLLPDGRVLLAGSNTHQFYTFTGTFPTELRVEAFSPPYLAANFNNIRPSIATAPTFIGYKQVFDVVFTTATRQGAVECNMQSAPWSTHSYSQGQRLIKLVTAAPVKAGTSWSVKCTAPPSANIAPQQYYMLAVVQNNVPSKAVWVKMG